MNLKSEQFCIFAIKGLTYNLSEMKDNPAQVSFDSKVRKFVIVDTLITFSVRNCI